MRAADFPGRLPQASSGRQSAAPLLLLFDCVTSATPFPQKSQTLASKDCERMPPPKPPLTAISEPDPIYPYLPFLFCSSFGNDCATNPSEPPETLKSLFAGVSVRDPLNHWGGIDLTCTRSIQPRQYKRPIIARSYGSALMSSSTSAGVL